MPKHQQSVQHPENGSLTGYGVHLRPVAEADLEQLRTWRNSPEVQRQMLTQQTISTEQQETWFDKIQQDTSQRHFVIEYKDKSIGAANIRAQSIDVGDNPWVKVEPGLYIGDSHYRSNLLAFAPMLVLNDFCFQQLESQLLVARVLKTNQAALNYNNKLGYESDGHDLDELQRTVVRLSLTEKAYETAAKPIKQLLGRHR